MEFGSVGTACELSGALTRRGEKSKIRAKFNKVKLA